jgi:hypothetical protein
VQVSESFSCRSVIIRSVQKVRFLYHISSTFHTE